MMTAATDVSNGPLAFALTAALCGLVALPNGLACPSGVTASAQREARISSLGAKDAGAEARDYAWYLSAHFGSLHPAAAAAEKPHRERPRAFRGTHTRSTWLIERAHVLVERPDPCADRCSLTTLSVVASDGAYAAGAHEGR